MPPDQVPSKFSRWSPLWKNWYIWLHQKEISPQAACLAFAKSQPEIDHILVGVENRHQLGEILTAFHSPTPEFFPSIESIDPDLINPSQWSKL
jgi:aryl-alcohol dehydrogenase-like predicted oxidoreductase